MCRSGKEHTSSQNRFQSVEAEINSSLLEETHEESTVSRQSPGYSGCKMRCRSRKQYRTNSPSYQAVEMEYDQFFRFRESNQENPAALNIFGWNPDRPMAVPIIRRGMHLRLTVAALIILLVPFQIVPSVRSVHHHLVL